MFVMTSYGLTLREQTMCIDLETKGKQNDGKERCVYTFSIWIYNSLKLMQMHFWYLTLDNWISGVTANESKLKCAQG